MGGWKEGFGVSTRVSALAPVAAVGLLVLSVVFQGESGDIRKGALPWTASLGALCLVLCCLGVINAHRSNPNRWILIGGWWTSLAMIGIAGFMLAIGVGDVLGIEEEDVGVFSWIPLIGMAFGLLSMAPALVVLGIGATRSALLPVWGRAAIWVAALAFPSFMVFTGLTDGTLEFVGSNGLLGVFGLSWLVLGLALLRISPQAGA